ncbi:hypothetical protein CANCADRAFT_60132 [Tortispora caseinolytica NRRL Y-17796]|uniref:Uncharacterized protein n=1 Tax=Tortispora caseinolytica NRRL Y-17796 TaxID=767744 RepID=A0A1E4TMC2_9ASCO|nr:hypothetical protein CANCADRAFT_60132 [Tortispora caseinolytica NRRL Y-17796]
MPKIPSQRRQGPGSGFTPYSGKPGQSTPVPRRSQGGLISRVKALLTPAKWMSDSGSRSQETEDLQTPIKENGISSSYSSPSKRSPSGSPSQKLAEFFRENGDRPLTDIETEGVMSLIRQATGIPTLGTPLANPNTPTSLITSPSVLSNDYPADDIRTPATMQHPAASNPSTTTLSASENSPVTVPKYNPKYKDIVKPRTRFSAGIVTPKASFPSLSTPFKSSAISSAMTSNSSSGPEVADNHSNSQKEADTQKLLSRTATTLISLLTEPEEDAKEGSTDSSGMDIEPDENPYVEVDIVPKSTHTTKSEDESPKQSQEEEQNVPLLSIISKARPEIKGTSSPAPLNQMFENSKDGGDSLKLPLVSEKYRPTKSSSLRLSFSAEPDIQMGNSDRSSKPQPAKPSPFVFGRRQETSIEISPSRPLAPAKSAESSGFHFGGPSALSRSAISSDPSQPPSQSMFDFNAKKTDKGTQNGNVDSTVAQKVMSAVIPDEISGMFDFSSVVPATLSGDLSSSKQKARDAPHELVQAIQISL